MKEIYLFIKRFFAAPSAIGSLFPSSKKLGLCIAAKSGQETRRPLRFLEIGAGSGALTRQLVQKMQKEDLLDIVEKDPRFCVSLRGQFSHMPNVVVHEISIIDFKGKGYDFLISSLPLNAFRSQLVNEILIKYESLVKSGGSLTYYEYLGFEKIKQAILFGKSASDFKYVQNLKSNFESKYGKNIEKIWWNIPPARVIHCEIEKVQK